VDGEDTVRRILIVAERQFAAVGYGTTTNKTIAVECDLSAAALYHHFGSKAGLFLAVADEVYELFIGGLRSALDGVTDFDEALDALITRAGELHTGDPTIAPMAITIQLEVQRSATLRHELAVPLASFRELADDVAALAPAQLLHGRAPRSMALAVTALMNGLCSLAATLHDPRAFVDVAQSLRGLLVR
jgi:AcrR family transcriptional regulator